jgi:hypothetical protein
LQLIATTGGLSRQLEEVKQSLQTFIEQERCPSQVADQLQELASMVVGNTYALCYRSLPSHVNNI